jgi:hypothetical protein
VAFLAVLIAAFILIAAPELPQFPFPPPMHCDDQGRAHDQDCRALAVVTAALRRSVDFVDAHHNVFIVLGTLAIAWFTFTLWQSTHLLWRASRDQAQDTKASIAVAARAAKAAETQAQTAVSVEVPRFTVQSIRAGNGSPAPMALKESISVTLINDGRTTAIVTTEVLCFRAAPALGAALRYPFYSVKDRNFGVRVENGKPYVVLATPMLTDGEINEVMTEQTPLWVYGYIQYRDFMDNTYQKGFVGALQLGQEVRSASGHPGREANFVERGPVHFTYTRRMTGEEPA